MRLWFWALTKSYPRYQPIYINGRLITSAADRNCLDRWTLIKNEIAASGSRSVLDLGSAEGFYVIQSAKECGCISLGVDDDPRRLAVAQNQILSENIQNAGFAKGKIDLELLDKIPNCDAVIFMSVLHHIMYTNGLPYSLEILRKIRAKTNKFMIFEMGQSNETKNKWAAALPDMGSNPHEWIRNLLQNAGFSKIIKIGESDSYARDQRRAIFKAEV